MKRQKKRFENNWRSKSLESLEMDSWGPAPSYESYLVRTCHQLRRKPLNEFETEDLRIMVGQDIGLRFLVPLAIEVLQQNILAEGHLYKGDLLKVVLTCDEEYWKAEKDNWLKICELVEAGMSMLKDEAAQNDTGRDIMKAYKDFRKLN